MSELYLSKEFRDQALAEAKRGMFAGPDNAVITWLVRLAELELALIQMGITLEVQGAQLGRAQRAWVEHEAKLVSAGRRQSAELEELRKERADLYKQRAKMSNEILALRREARRGAAGADHERLSEIEELRNNAAAEAEERDRAAQEGRE